VCARAHDLDSVAVQQFVPDVLVMKVLMEGMLMDKHDSEYFYQRFATSHHRPVDEPRLLMRQQDMDFLVRRSTMHPATRTVNLAHSHSPSLSSRGTQET